MDNKQNMDNNHNEQFTEHKEHTEHRAEHKEPEKKWYSGILSILKRGGFWEKLILGGAFLAVLNFLLAPALIVMFVAQMAHFLIMGRPNQLLTELGEKLAIFFKQIIQYACGNTDEKKPFPFSMIKKDD